MLFYYNISGVYFGNGDLKNALKYINWVLNETDAKLRADVFSFARLVNLIIHYELGNYDLLEYTIKSTKRYVTKNQRNYKFESVFLKDIRKLIKIKNADDIIKTFISFKKDLLETLKDDYEKSALEYFNFIAWLDSKIKKQSFSEIVKKKIEEQLA